MMMVMIMMTMRMMTASDIAIVLLRMASWSITRSIICWRIKRVIMENMFRCLHREPTGLSSGQKVKSSTTSVLPWRLVKALHAL